MRSAILLCVFVLFGYLTNAQFSILPKVGFENSLTSVEMNGFSSFSPTGYNLSPQAGVRLDYKNKQLHGPFIGLATTRSIVKFNFSDPATAISANSTSRGSVQLRLEGGYQVSTKPIYFKKAGSSNKSSEIYSQQNLERTSCGKYMMRRSCGNKAASAAKAKAAADKGSWVRIQPSVGVAYIPFSPSSDINTKMQGTQTTYEYNAGNWKTALLGGIGFEFGKNDQRTIMLSFNYLKSLGNLASENITTASGSKPINTQLQSNVSGWNVNLGIPISLNKKKPVAKTEVIEKKKYTEEKRCGQYRIQYRSRCMQ
ncbi:MAG: hypothetical protein ABIN01_04055 [Ferruginibacter sp.]